VSVALMALVLLSAGARPAPAAAGAPVLAEALAAGDALYARRSAGAHGGTAQAAPIEAAMVQYRRAVSADPRSYPARLALLRAMFFRGGFCEIALKDQVRLFEEAKRLADETVRLLEADLKIPRIAARREVLRREPLAAEIYLWSAVSWGQWATTHKLGAVWQGAARQIRDLAQAVVDIEPDTLYGSGFVILGRLHAEAPRVPMLTPWISREKAIEYLTRALAIAPESTSNMYFLAEALLAIQPERKREVVELLERCANAAPRPGLLVEDAHYAEEARALLAEAAKR